MGTHVKRIRFAGVSQAFVLGALLSACGSHEAMPIAPETDAQALQATAHYGSLVVRLGRTPVHRAKVRPWTSYWFPKGETTLFEGASSPLSKYDAFVRTARGRASNAARLEQEFHESRRWDAWEGHCDAWAIAAILQQPEPRAVDLGGGIELSAEDVKALVIKSYETLLRNDNGSSPLLYFGHRYNGLLGETPSQRDPSDIRPDQFHRVLQGEIAERGMPFLMDKDPDLAVWNHPIYAWYSDIGKGPRPGELQVTTAVQYVNMRQRFQGDLLAESVWKEYTYTLKARRIGKGRYEVTGGEWVGGSVQDHPDFLTVIAPGFDRSRRRSRNSSVDTAVVDEILTRSVKAQ